MKYSEMIARMRRRLQETSGAFYSDNVLKQYCSEGQRALVREIEKLLPVKRSFTTVATQAEYAFDASCGQDLMLITRISYDDLESLDFMLWDTEYVVSPSDGVSISFSTRGDTLILSPVPDAAVTCYVFGYRLPPQWVLSIIHDGSGGVTSATVAIASNTLTLTTNLGTNTFSLTNTSYDTLSELAAAVTALSGWTATRSTDVRAAETSSLLEDIATTSAYQTAIELYENPEVPNYALDALWEYGLWKAFEEDDEQNLAAVHEKRYLELRDSIHRTAQRRWRGTRQLQMKDSYNVSRVNTSLRHPGGGWVVV